MDLYQFAIRPLLFSGGLGDPETLHNRAIALVEWLGDQRQYPLGRIWFDRIRREFDAIAPGTIAPGTIESGTVESGTIAPAGSQAAPLAQDLWGLRFDQPIGLAAGFDKNGRGAIAWEALGFGFAELGTVTLHAQPGNPPPRLFRLVDDEAIINRMGFNNDGAAALAQRLRFVRETAWAVPTIPLGANLGKSKITDLAAAPADYVGSFKLLADWADYFVVNVSSPNTPGLRSLQDRPQLAAILAALQDVNQGRKPLLVKIAPDLSWAAIDDVLALAIEHRLAGIVATNTTIDRQGLATRQVQPTGQAPSDEPGGLSGRPLRSRSTAILQHLCQQAGGRSGLRDRGLVLIGVGGIFSAADVWEKIAAGASLIQIYTGWIYQGPGLARQIGMGLIQELAQRGFSSLSAAIEAQAQETRTLA